jgi:hypothetical protein
MSDEYVALAVQGELQAAHVLLLQPRSGALSVDEKELIIRFEDRFIEPGESIPGNSGDPFIDEVINTFQAYWRKSLMGKLSGPQAAGWLNSTLSAVMQRHDIIISPENSNEMQSILGRAIEKRGFHYLQSPGPPVRDLLVWRDQRSNSYLVDLPTQTRRVNVYFAAGFALQGWKHFASLGLASTTGWIEDGNLHCVEWAYDRNSENFEVSFLKHETRHLADFDQFPALDTIELEYRAKLTELAYANRSLRRLLDDFTRKAAPNPVSPHAFASYRVTRDIYQELYAKTLPATANPWSFASTARVNKAARDILARNTGHLIEVRGQSRD